MTRNIRSLIKQTHNYYLFFHRRRDFFNSSKINADLPTKTSKDSLTQTSSDGVVGTPINFDVSSKIEGKDSNEWKLVDGIDLIIHIFHPEKRRFYELEKIWSELIPKEKLII